MVFRSFGGELCLEGFGRGTSARWSSPWLSLILLFMMESKWRCCSYCVSFGLPPSRFRERTTSLFFEPTLFFRGTTQIPVIESCLLSRASSRKGRDVDNLMLGCWLFNLWILAIADCVCKGEHCALIHSFVLMSRTFYIFVDWIDPVEGQLAPPNQFFFPLKMKLMLS